MENSVRKIEIIVAGAFWFFNFRPDLHLEMFLRFCVSLSPLWPFLFIVIIINSSLNNLLPSAWIFSFLHTLAPASYSLSL